MPFLLPDATMRFFTPNEKFFRWAKAMWSSERKMVIDAGCGDGHLVLELRQRKIPTIGVDPNWDALNGPRLPEDPARFELTWCILAMRAEDCPLVKNTPAIILTCRPSHCGFPARVAASRHEQSRQFYVGLEKNIDADLGPAESLRKRVLDGVGQEGEDIWEVLR